MRRVRLPLTLATAGAALALLAGCSGASAIEPFTSDDGYEFKVEQVGDVITSDDGEKEACMFGVTVKNATEERAYYGDITGNAGGVGDYDTDVLESHYSFSADGKVYEDWPVPGEGWTATILDAGETGKWIKNVDCDGVKDGGTVEVNLDDTDRKLTVRR